MVEINWDATIQELQRGWGKGQYGGDENGRYLGAEQVCLLGAIQVANQLDLNASLVFAEKALNPIIKEQFPDRTATGYVPHFNDHAETTLDDVILVCEKARASETL